MPLLLLPLTLAACDGGAPTPSAAGGTGENVLLVTLDTTRADYLGTYGREGDPTPRLDALAAAGTRFDLAIATASVTPVAHAAILTGRDNPRHGLRVLTGEGGYRLPGDVPTLATVLGEHGYHTAAIHSAFPVSSYFGLDRGFAHFDDLYAELTPAEDGEHKEWGVARFQRRSDETTDRVLAHLDAVSEPFFLWIHYWDPHDAKVKPPGNTTKRYVDVYPEEVAYMDSQIGRMLDGLAARGFDERTIVVVVSDHGQGLGDHGWGGHRILFQEQIRVPLLLRAPGREQVPSVDALVRTTDILPTVLDYLGLPTPGDVQGASLRGLVEGRAEPGRVAFADQLNRFDQNAKIVEDRPLDDLLYCAMDAEWKLVYRPSHPEESELFHLASDPEEARNVHAEHPDEVLRLMKELAHQSPWVLQPFERLDDADREGALGALSALGYTEGSEGSGGGELGWVWSCPDPAHGEEADVPRACAACGTPFVPRAR